MTGVRVSLCVLLAVAVLFVVGSAAGATGALDPSFGIGGTVTTGWTGPEGVNRATALLVQPDGKLVAVGYSATSPEDVPDATSSVVLARFDPDGTEDASFGSKGAVLTTFPDAYAWADAAALQPDGKIVVAGAYDGSGPTEFLLARYNPDGSLDTTFGSGGIVTTLVGDGDSEGFGVVLQPNGEIVAGGDASDSSGNGSALVRYLSDGSLDTSFGTGGIVLDTQAGENGFAGIALQPDGKILGVGQLRTRSSSTPLTRFNADGTLDSSFGSGGMSNAPMGDAAAVTLQPDGKIVVVGERANGFAVTRVDQDGTADPSFGSGGTVTTPMGSGSNGPSAVVVQPDAKIVVAGGSQGGFTVARYNQDGSLDPTFGSGGIVTTLSSDPSGPYPDWVDAGAYAVALQPDGKIDVAGSSAWGGQTGTELSLARYVANGGTLTVHEAGSGTGSVMSKPAGVDCSATCSANLSDVPFTLTATPSDGSVFAGWSGACSGTGTCQVQLSADESVTATFSLAPPESTSTPKPPPACLAPKTKGKSLTEARRMIKRAHCRTGTIRHSYSKVKKSHVISEKPGHGRRLRHGAKINLLVSKGRRPSHTH